MNDCERNDCTNERPYIRPRWCKPSSPILFDQEDGKVEDVPGNQTDVNEIIERFARTGIMPPTKGGGTYADVTNLQQTSLTELIEKGKEAMATLKELERREQAQPQQRDEPKPEQAPADPEPQADSSA